jgi:hypothetical protein
MDNLCRLLTVGRVASGSASPNAGHRDLHPLVGRSRLAAPNLCSRPACGRIRARLGFDAGRAVAEDDLV